MRVKRKDENRSIPNTAATLVEETLDAEKKSAARLIPWEDIWTSLSIAQLRGNGDMIEVFYDTLFREAVFDDHGAWSIDLKRTT